MAEFLDGIIVKNPNSNAPDFVIGSLSFNVDKFTASLREKENKGWVNAQIKRSRDGKLYVELDTYQRDQSGPPR